MISLSELEQNVRSALPDPDIELVAVNLPCDKKGESIVVLHEAELDGEAVKKQMLSNGTSNLMLPSRWTKVPTIPTLGSGKTDFATAKKLAAA